MRGRGRTAYQRDTGGWAWGETWATWWHIERLMSISRHTSRGERLDGTDWDFLHPFTDNPSTPSLYKKSSALALFLPLVSSIVVTGGALSFLK